MTTKINLSNKTIFWITAILALISIWIFTIGQENNIEFKNPEIKKGIYEFLILTVPLSFILTTIALWRIIEDTFQTKFLISVVLLSFALGTSLKYFGELFDFNSKQWQTRKINASIDNLDQYYQIEQEKIDYFLFHKPYERRIVKAKEFGILFWEIKKIESEGAIRELDFKANK